MVTITAKHSIKVDIMQYLFYVHLHKKSVEIYIQYICFVILINMKPNLFYQDRPGASVNAATASVTRSTQGLPVTAPSVRSCVEPRAVGYVCMLNLV